jgi:hypothetical protein
MFKDFEELLSVFNDHKVKYLVIGGYAVSYYSQPRATKDLDVLIKPDIENARAVYEALREFGAPLSGLVPDDFVQRDKFFRMGSPPLMVDILPEIGGVDFDQAWQRRVEVPLDPEMGLTASFISSDDLISAKLAAGRPQDLADVDALRKAHGSRTESRPDTPKQEPPTP